MSWLFFREFVIAYALLAFFTAVAFFLIVGATELVWRLRRGHGERERAL